MTSSVYCHCGVKSYSIVEHSIVDQPTPSDEGTVDDTLQTITEFSDLLPSMSMPSDIFELISPPVDDSLPVLQDITKNTYRLYLPCISFYYPIPLQQYNNTLCGKPP